MTTLLAVMGNPVEHSRSPTIHEAFADSVGIDLNYEKILVPEGQFESMAKDFMIEGFGLNITLPFKGQAFQLVDLCSNKAEIAQSVNTISRNNSGQIIGDNTDGGGLKRDLLYNLGWSLEAKNLLILGAGGAVRGVIADLLETKPFSIDLWNRTHLRALELERQFNNSRLRAVDSDNLSSGYDVIINGTSAGLSSEVIQLPRRIVKEHSHCYDMIYGQAITDFNRWCLKQADCIVADGLGMLVEQAALAFEIWFDVEVQTNNVIKRLRESL